MEVIEHATQELRERTGNGSLRVIHDGEKFAVQKEVHGEFRRQSGSASGTCNLARLEKWDRESRHYIQRPVPEIMREDQEAKERVQEAGRRERREDYKDIGRDMWRRGRSHSVLITNNPLAK